MREAVVVLGLEMPQRQIQPSACFLLSIVGTCSQRKTPSQACGTEPGLPWRCCHWTRQSFGVGAVLGTVGCLVASPVSTQQTRAAPHPWDNHQSFQRVPDAPWGAKSPKVKTTALDKLPQAGYQASSQRSAPQHMPGLALDTHRSSHGSTGARRPGRQRPCVPRVAAGLGLGDSAQTAWSVVTHFG